MNRRGFLGALAVAPLAPTAQVKADKPVSQLVQIQRWRTEDIIEASIMPCDLDFSSLAEAVGKFLERYKVLPNQLFVRPREIAYSLIVINTFQNGTGMEISAGIDHRLDDEDAWYLAESNHSHLKPIGSKGA